LWSSLIVAVLSAGVLAAQAVQHERRIVLAGAPNFRDIGGYKTTDGHTVRWGLVYRSGELSHLTDADYEQLAKLGISAVCDFRNSNEQQSAPTHWNGSQPPEFVSLPNPPPAEAGVIQSITGGTEAVRSNYLRWYREVVTVYAPSYRVTFHRILASTAPVLYHCSAGKDRTGYFTALLLTVLGVPHETVVEDFLLTNTFLPSPTQVDALLKSTHGSREAVVAAMNVEPSYLDAAFDEINKKFGSLDNYRRTQLGLSDADVAQLKARLLEP
jgi:protein-tyrosine phosphatase